MIIYGTRMYFKRNRVVAYGKCGQCGRYCKQVSYQARSFIHVYFIPFIPTGARVQVLGECSKCRMGKQLAVSELQPIATALDQEFKAAVMEIQEGNNTLTSPEGDEPVNIGVALAGMLENLYLLNQIRDISSLSELLQASEMQFEDHVVRGRWLEMKGKLEEAGAEYYAAHEIRSDEPAPLYQMGRIAIIQNNGELAEKCLGRYSELCPEDYSPLAELVDFYSSRKEHDKVVAFCDKLFSAVPGLLGDKDFCKTYKKACKKAGITGEFLQQA